MTEQTEQQTNGHASTIDALTEHFNRLRDAYEHELSVLRERLNLECARVDGLAEKLAALHIENERLTEELREVRRRAGEEA